MSWLNYHHLHYFWTAVRAGSISAASRELRLSQPTLSTQIRALEGQLGERLLERSRRGLTLTPAGRVAFEHAERIFALGAELQVSVKRAEATVVREFRVGVAEALPKHITHQLLLPALAADVHLVCEEDKTETLLAELSVERLDLVIADVPMTRVRVRAFNHFLGDSGTTFLAAPALARRLRPGFPGSLDGAPFLLPTANNVVRRALDPWLDLHRIRPRVVGEFDERALLKLFGRDGHGVFTAPTVIERELAKEHGVEVVGRTDEVKESFYAITLERKVRHPLSVAVVENAKETLRPRRR